MGSWPKDSSDLSEISHQGLSERPLSGEETLRDDLAGRDKSALHLPPTSLGVHRLGETEERPSEEEQPELKEKRRLRSQRWGGSQASWKGLGWGRQGRD